MSLTLTSPAFESGGDIPAIHTCDGQDISPPLSWSGIPGNTRSLALIVEDPDAPDPAAPKRVFTHWVLYNIPADINGLAQGITSEQLPPGTQEGLNDWNRPGFGGPCPPVGRHRYFHKLYALDTVLPDLDNPTKSDLLNAMRDHVIAQAELVGFYQRSQ